MARRGQGQAAGARGRGTGSLRPARQDHPAAAQGLQPFALRAFRAIGRREIDHQPDRAQRDQSDAGDDLAAFAGARRLDRARAGGKRRRALHREGGARRHSGPRLRRRQDAARDHRLDRDGRMAAMVRCALRAGRRARIGRPPARLGRVPLGARRASSRSRSRARRSARRPARRCATAATGRTSCAASGARRAARPWCASSRQP